MWAAWCLEPCCVACVCEARRMAVGSFGRCSAHIAYCSLFTFWALHEVDAPLLQSIPWIHHFHKTPDHEWFETNVVFRVSLGNFPFFTIVAAIMAGIKDHNGWMAKIFCWVVIIFLLFFVPNSIVSFYG